MSDTTLIQYQMNSGIIPVKHSEDIFSNPFYEILRSNYSQLLTDSSIVVVPSTETLASVPKSIISTRKFAESHVLVSAFVPNLFCAVRGNPVEQRGDRLVSTIGAENDKAVATILHSENMYDVGNSFKVLVVDRPLIPGDFSQGISTQSVNRSPKNDTVTSGGGPSEYLSAVPLVEQDFFEKLVRIRKTYLLVPGYEGHLAQKIKDMSTITSNQLSRYLQPSPPLEVIQADVERAAYATLHTWIYQHILEVTGESLRIKENVSEKSSEKIGNILRELHVPVSLLSVVPTLEEEIVPQFSRLAFAVTPQQKINYLQRIFDKIESIILLNNKSFGADELLAVLTVSVVLAGYTRGQADVAYMETFLGVHEDLGAQKPAFLVTTFNSCIQFLARAVV